MKPERPNPYFYGEDAKWPRLKRGYPEIFQRSNVLLDNARQVGASVVHLIGVYEKNLESGVSQVRVAGEETGENIEVTVDGITKRVSECVHWDEGNHLVPDISRKPEDSFYVSTKRNAFASSDAALIDWLNERGIRRIISTGFLGRDCVLRTAAGAHASGFKSFIAVECTDAYWEHSYGVVPELNQKLIDMLNGKIDWSTYSIL